MNCGHKQGGDPSARGLAVAGLPARSTPIATWGGLLLVILLVVPEVWPQAAAEYAGASAAASATTVKTTTPAKPAAAAGKKTAFLHLPARMESREAVEEKNRRGLEETAGPDAGKLLLRSVPSKARIWVNGKPVGYAPLLLILAPGTYQVAMGDETMGTAKQEVSLLPKETHTTVLTLASRYPRQVRLR